MYIPFAHTARKISYVVWLRSMFRRSACEVRKIWRKKTRPALGECLAATVDLPAASRLLKKRYIGHQCDINVTSMPNI